MLRNLTPRELDTVALVAMGRTNKQIGAALTLTVNTAKVYVARAMHKTGTRNRVELAVWWLKGEDEIG